MDFLHELCKFLIERSRNSIVVTVSKLHENTKMGNTKCQNSIILSYFEKQSKN